MKRLTANTIGILQGDETLFEDFEDGGEMWTGTGQRERRKPVRFSEGFTDAPVVHCSLSLWDVDNGANMRAHVEAENVGAEGFDLVFRTWGDTRIARVRLDWIAIGSVANEDDWELY
ncbi:H-type lectin domain-containing protein [Aquicoccus porphyridii]|uniref:H-type lectin domain-containing protein n=1 Tax=Aquicoccus porphyridii TaxID=1852029 RepID=UPI00165DF353|nr:H-type lectin domain-containing protein [Aquicoccus porphyridii]